MIDPKILELAQIHEAEFELAGCKFIVREPSAMDMLTYRELSDEKEQGGSKAKGVAFLIEKSVRNLDGSNAFSKEEALHLANGSGKVALPIIKAVMQWMGDDIPKVEVTGESSPLN